MLETMRILEDLYRKLHGDVELFLTSVCDAYYMYTECIVIVMNAIGRRSKSYTLNG